MLLRQQSLYNAMYYSNYLGAKLQLWSNRDHSVLNDIIARIGIPLEEAKQQYKYMHHKYKAILREKVLEVAQRFGLHDIMYRSFIRVRQTTHTPSQHSKSTTRSRSARPTWCTASRPSSSTRHTSSISRSRAS